MGKGMNLILASVVIVSSAVSFWAGVRWPSWGFYVPVVLMSLLNVATGAPGSWTLSSGKLFLAAFIAAAAVDWIRERRAFAFPTFGLVPLAGAYIAVGFASSLASGGIGAYGWWYLGKDTGYVLAFAGARRLLGDRDQPLRAIRVMVGTGAVVAILMYVQVLASAIGFSFPLAFWSGTGLEHLVAAGSTIGHKNYYASYMLLTVCLTLGWMQAEGRRDAALYLLVVLEAVSLFLAESLTGVVVLVCAVGGWRLSRRVGWLRAAVVSAGLAVLLVSGWWAVVTGKFVFPAGRLVSVSSMESRAYPFEAGMELLRQRPLLGHGPGSFVRQIILREKELSASGLLPPFRQEGGISSHNAYVEAAVERGIPGLVLLFSLLAGLILPLLWPNPPAGERPAGALARWIGVGLVAVCLHGLTENVLTHTVLMFQFLFAAALGWSILHLPTAAEGGKQLA